MRCARRYPGARSRGDPAWAAGDAGRSGGDVGFWAEILALPTAIYTALLMVAGLYWLAVVLGSLDIDILDLDGLDDVGGIGDVADAGDVDAGDGPHGLVWFMSALGLRGVPLTFTLSMLTLWSWALCFLGMHHLVPLLPSLPGWLLGTGVFLGSFVVGLLGTSLSVRPFQRVFKTHHAPSKHGFVGRPVTITTATVDASFGQALCADGGAGLVVAVRYEGPRKLGKGQRAVLVDYDEKRDVYTVEPLDLDDEPPVRSPRPAPAPEPEADRDRADDRGRRQEPERAP